MQKVRCFLRTLKCWKRSQKDYHNVGKVVPLRDYWQILQKNMKADIVVRDWYDHRLRV